MGRPRPGLVMEPQQSSSVQIVHPAETPPFILSYRGAIAPKRSRFSYFWIVFFALVRLAFGICFAIGGLCMTVAGIFGLIEAGHPDNLPCAAIAWGPLLVPLGIYWFRRAIDILDSGRDYNPHY
jgi:hypothetical protein